MSMGSANCFYNGNGGLTCNSQATCVVCEGSEALKTLECDVFGEPVDGAGYITDLICTW